MAGEPTEARTFPWGALTYGETARVRAALAARYAPVTANKMLAALRGVLREAWRLGEMEAERYQRAADLPAVRGTTMPRGRALGTHELHAIFAVCAADSTPAGVDLVTVQELAGHAHVTTTVRYDRRGEARKQRAAQRLHVPYARPATVEDDRVAETPPGLFAVACRYCGRQLLTVDRLRDPEIAILEEHLRACYRLEPLGDAPPLGEIMRRLSVTARRGA